MWLRNLRYGFRAEIAIAEISIAQRILLEDEIGTVAESIGRVSSLVPNNQPFRKLERRDILRCPHHISYL